MTEETQSNEAGGATAEALDISSIQAGRKTVEILHPGNDEKKIGLRIFIVSEHSDEVKKAQRKNLNAQINSKKSKMTAAQIDQNNMNLLVAATVGWEWYGENLHYKGDYDPEFSAEKVEEVYRAMPWIRTQVKTDFDVTGDFFEA